MLEPRPIYSFAMVIALYLGNIAHFKYPGENYDTR